MEPDYKVYPISITQQKTPSWGLARISSKQKLTTATRDIYTYDDEAAGKGVNAYVIDTGVLAEHDVITTYLYILVLINSLFRILRVGQSLDTMLFQVLKILT